MATQFDCDSDQLQRIKEKAHRRQVLREQFLKETSNPFRHASGEGGVVFDPAIQRHQAMRLSAFEHFKANMKTVRLGIVGLLGPMVLYGYYVKKSRDEKERQYRNGLVAYKDRLFKLI